MGLNGGLDSASLAALRAVSKRQQAARTCMWFEPDKTLLISIRSPGGPGGFQVVENSGLLRSTCGSHRD